MISLIYIAILGVLCLVIELLNLRKYIFPFVISALVGAVFLSIQSPMQDYFDGMININRFYISFAPVLICISIFLILMSKYFYQDRIESITDYISIKIFILTGALAMISFGNLVMFFLGIEILSISLYILVGTDKTKKESNEAAFKYFLMGSFASGILMLGITFVYGITGSFDLAEIAQMVEKNSSNVILQLGVLLITVAILFKASAVPFHFWSPDVYQGSPILNTVQMSTLVKVAVFASFFKLFSVAFLPMLFFTGSILAIISALSMTVGNLSAFKQNNVKRLLAFSGISHAGFMLMALLSPTKGYDSILFYSTSYALASIGLFSVAIALLKQTNNETISAFNGLAKKQPFVAVLITISLLSMAGIPPLAGFWAKYYLFIDLVKDYFWLVIVAIINSAASIFVYFKFIWAMFTKDQEDSNFFQIPKIYFTILVICSVILFILGIFPNLLDYL